MLNKKPGVVILSLFFGMLFNSGCDNDIELLDQYRETTVIYGLLNVTDTVQYIRLEKAFLGEGNALLMAQHADSIYYDTLDVELTLLRYTNSILTDSIILQPTDQLSKEEGLFVNYPHIIYKTTGNELLDPVSTYKLIFYNKKSGKTVFGQTPIVKLVGLNPLIPSPLPDPSSTLNLAADDPMQIRIISPVNSKFLSLLIRINYTDSITGTNQTKKQTLDYNLEMKVTANTNGGQQFEYLIDGEAFYQFLGRHIKMIPGVYRDASLFNLDFIFTAGAEEFYTYYIVNNSTSSVSDNIPDYTNLTNGIGIFSSRSVKIYPKKMLNNASMDSLKFGQYTGGLFQ